MIQIPTVTSAVSVRYRRKRDIVNTEQDPREDATLLRRFEADALIVDEPPQARAALRPPRRAKCEKCGSESVSYLPFFSAGSGIAYRPYADDIICHRCAHIGSYALS